MVQEFLSNYQNHVEIAKNNSEGLGRLFDPADYPSEEEVRSKFGFRLVFSPVPESGDFRLDVPHRELQELKKEYDENFTSRLGEAMREPWDRLHTLLTGMSEKLKEGDEDKKKRYHDTLITNAEDLCSLLTHLNVTKDPDLERARKMLEASLQGADIDTLKESPEAREGMKSKVDQILKQFEW